MKRARIVYGGAIHEATDLGAERLRLADGRVVGAGDVQWLVPFQEIRIPVSISRRVSVITSNTGEVPEPIAAMLWPGAQMSMPDPQLEAYWRWKGASGLKIAR